MTDKELLELAAKAEGTVYQDATIECVYRGGPVFLRPDGGLNFQWDPLIDDADAFQLAVKLNLALLFPMRGDAEPMVGAGQVGSMTAAKEEPVGKDKYAATRRAIVRAAAQCGLVDAAGIEPASARLGQGVHI